MRFKDNPGIEPLSKAEIETEIFTLANDFRKQAPDDGTPNKVHLPSGDVVEGEMADQYVKLLHEMIKFLDTTVYHLERLTDDK